MKISCIQMNMKLGCPGENYAHAKALITKAAKDSPDVILLPEAWNTGFYPPAGLRDMAEGAQERTSSEIGSLARQYGINIIAGSISSIKQGCLYNTAMVFDRSGRCIASYDKTHLFSPMGENELYTPGSSLCTFPLDGVPSGLIICYDIRFPELVRSLALSGMDMLFTVSQWPDVRISQFHTLAAARAIENQVYVACCNSCGCTSTTRFGGNSILIDPLGRTIARAGTGQEILSGEFDLSRLPGIRSAIPVFKDRRADIYSLR